MEIGYTDGLPLAEFAVAPERVLGVEASNCTLHYSSPTHGGWGVVRTSLLVPESYVLFVCPAACGRHGAIAAFEQGYRDRVGYLCLSDEEIVLGTYQTEIAKGVEDALARLSPRPKALFVCVTCIDDLLGTDHDEMLRELEHLHGIPIRLARMNPIATDGPLPPAQRIQETMYQFLSPASSLDSGINLLGCFSPLAPGGDLERMVERLGVGPLRHPVLCGSFAEFQSMAKSRFAVVVRPEGRAAAKYSETVLRTRVLTAPIAYSEALVRQRLEDIAETFGDGFVSPGAFVDESVAGFMVSARLSGARAAIALDGASVAIDSTATASPFDMALALTEAGITVTRIYAETMQSHEKASMARLTELSPETLVVNPAHARRHAGRPSSPLADIAIGFTAGYATAAPRTCAIAFDEGLYGFSARDALFSALADTAASLPTSLEEQVKAYGLVI